MIFIVVDSNIINEARYPATVIFSNERKIFVVCYGYTTQILIWELNIIVALPMVLIITIILQQLLTL